MAKNGSWDFGDVEVFLAAQRLNAVVAVISDFKLTQEVTFKTRHLLFAPLANMWPQ